MPKKIEKEIPNEKWDEEAEQNWIGFLNILMKEQIKQNPNSFKKNHHKEVNGRQFSKKINNIKYNEKITQQTKSKPSTNH